MALFMALSQFYYKNNRLQQLRGFYYTVLKGNASEAAKVMGLHPSAISQQLTSLERDLGLELFNKTTRPASLTQDGKRFYERIVPLVQHIDGVFEEFLQDKSEQEHNYLAIAAIHTAIVHLLPPMIKKFKEANPDVRISIANIGRDEAIERLKNNTIDIALYPVMEVPAECEFMLLREYKPILLLNPDHPLAHKEEVTLEDIAPYEFLRVDPHNSTVPLIEEVLRHYQVRWTITFEHSDWEIMKALTRHNVGVTIVTDICLEEGHGLVRKPMDKYFPPMPYGFLLKKGQFRRTQVESFLQIAETMKLEEGSWLRED